jgi:hypothetical protein
VVAAVDQQPAGPLSVAVAHALVSCRLFNDRPDIGTAADRISTATMASSPGDASSQLMGQFA